MMRNILIPLFGVAAVVFFGSFTKVSSDTYTMKIEVVNLRNEVGNVQFALYNKNGSIPDQHYKSYYKIGTAEINNNKASFIFTNLPEGVYAVNILHDENKNGKVDKGMILPKEGIGFSNYQAIGLSNRPNFEKASFSLKSDRLIKVKVIYM